MPRNELIITVHKDELLSTLQQNRERHGEAFRKAKEGYIKLTKKELSVALEKLDRGEMIHRVLANVPPEDHTSDYAVAIDMMDWSTDDKIELDQQQFRQYVKDDWGWKENWVVSNTQYLEA